MNYGSMPLYPPMGQECCRGNCMRMALFRCDPHRRQDMCCTGKSVILENPCCPGECAEVHLSVDGCGNLEVCVHREPHGGCGCRRPSRPKNRGCWD
ncbi:MAG: hypothetical protein U0L09_01675 [Christensenellales bacterium]|nr:hypothetical protein [Christensenellales bacterium]